MSELTRTAIAIERDLLNKFDSWIVGHGYANRSEAVRDLVRGALIEDQWADASAEVVATLSIIYDHAERKLSQELTHIQHQDHDVVLCSQHVHLDHHRCLEVILLKGTAGQLRRITDTITATRGVIAGKLTLLSTKL